MSEVTYIHIKLTKAFYLLAVYVNILNMDAVYVTFLTVAVGVGNRHRHDIILIDIYIFK